MKRLEGERQAEVGDGELCKEEEVDGEKNSVGGGEPDGNLLPLPQGARAVRLLCTSVCSLLKEVEHPGVHFLVRL